MSTSPKKRKIRIPKLRSRDLLRSLGIVLLFSSALLLGGIVGTYSAVKKTVPDVSALETYEPSLLTTIYADDGRIIKEIGPEKRIVVTYDQIPDVLRKAILATEDPRFFKHKGIDVRGILRAVRENALNARPEDGNSRAGARSPSSWPGGSSSIPLQTVQRKLAEWFLAVQIEKRYSKEKIFEMYCNQFEFGHGAFGVEAAAHLFFGKGVADLTLEEAAVIAGIFRGPIRYSPYRYPERMLETAQPRPQPDGRGGLHLRPPRPRRPRRSPSASCPSAARTRISGRISSRRSARHIVDAYGEDVLYRGGLKVYTTLNPMLQQLRRGRPGQGPPRTRQAARLAEGQAQPAPGRGFPRRRNSARDLSRSGPGRRRGSSRTICSRPSSCVVTRKDEARVRIKGYLGKTDERRHRLDAGRRQDLDRLIKPGRRRPGPDQEQGRGQEGTPRLARAGAQGRGRVPGRSIPGRARSRPWSAATRSAAASSTGPPRPSARPDRPSSRLLYTAALENGFTAASRIVDEPTDFEDKWSEDHLVAASNYDRQYKGTVTLRKGLEESRNVVTANILDHISPQVGVDYCKRFGICYDDLSLSVPGPGDVRGEPPRDGLGLIRSFPNKGVRIKPYFITRIEDRDGNILEENKIEADDVISPQTAYLMTYSARGRRRAGHGRPGVAAPQRQAPGRQDRDDRQVYRRLVHRLLARRCAPASGSATTTTSPLGGNESGRRRGPAGLDRLLPERHRGREEERPRRPGREARPRGVRGAAEHHLRRDRPEDRSAGAPICKWRFMEAFLDGTRADPLTAPTRITFSSLDYAERQGQRER